MLFFRSHSFRGSDWWKKHWLWSAITAPLRKFCKSQVSTIMTLLEVKELRKQVPTVVCRTLLINFDNTEQMDSV